jgi:excinuclease ABC subunit B
MGSLIQTFGRAARNVDGRVILYADAITRSMRAAMEETARRRERQEAFNAENGITPATIRKKLESSFDSLYSPGDTRKGKGRGKAGGPAMSAEDWGLSSEDIGKRIQQLERDMREAAKELEFEKAAELRDRIQVLRQRLLAAD